MLDLLQKRENPFDKEVLPEVIDSTSDVVRKGDLTRFNISDETISTLKANGYNYLFPIQQATYEDVFEGNDLIGKDRTGSGKTLAFGLPVLERLRKRQKYFKDKKGQKPLVMVLVPTRELALQVSKEFEKLKNSKNEYRVLAVYGGTDINEQIFKLKAGIEVIVGTPGRIMDLQDRKELHLSKLKVMILDETDQMLNFGFQEDIEKILNRLHSDVSKKDRNISDVQFLLFSATLPPWVENIASNFMNRSTVRVNMIKDSEIKTSITVQHFCILTVTPQQKFSSISDIILVYGGSNCRCIVFTDTKEDANTIGASLISKINNKVLHGDINQALREEAFESFRSGNVRCIVATNVAARGLDIPEVDLIIQISPPKDIDAYIHRSGRTGRAGKQGICITLYTSEEKELIERIEYRAGIEMLDANLPTSDDLLKASARDITNSLGKIPENMLYNFNEHVDNLLSQFEPKEALTRALALLTSQTIKNQNKSLLLSAEGYVTYCIEMDKDIEALTYFWNVIKYGFGLEIFNSIKGMRFLASRKGAVFDIEDKHVKEFDEMIENFSNKSVKIYQIKALPELEALRSNSSQSAISKKKNFGNMRNNNNNQGFTKNNKFGNKFNQNSLSRTHGKNFDNNHNKQFNFAQNRGYNNNLDDVSDMQLEMADHMPGRQFNNRMAFNPKITPPYSENSRYEEQSTRNNSIYNNKINLKNQVYNDQGGFEARQLMRYQNEQKLYDQYVNRNVDGASRSDISPISLINRGPRNSEMNNYQIDDHNKRGFEDKGKKKPNDNHFERKSIKKMNTSHNSNSDRNFNTNFKNSHQQNNRFNEKDDGKKFMNRDDFVKPRGGDEFRNKNNDRSKSKFDKGFDKNRKTSDTKYERKDSFDNYKPKKDSDKYDKDRKNKEKNRDEGEIIHDGSTDSTKLFVSNLGETVDAKDINNFLEKKGYKPLDSYVVKNNEGRSKGFGYLSFRDSKSAQKAFKKLNEAKINGKVLRVCFAMKKNAS